MKRRNNGAGHIRQKPDGRWEALYYVHGERRYITGRKGETASDVQKRLNEALHNLDRGIETPKDNRLALGDYLDDWLVTRRSKVAYGYWVRLEQYIRLHIKPVLGRVPLTKLTAQQLEALYDQKLAEGQAPNTVKHMHNAIHIALKKALRLGLVMQNVADIVDPPTVVAKEMKTYNLQQVVQFLNAAKGHRLEAMFWMMPTTGMRLGELLGLRWDAIDFDTGKIRVVSALKDVKSTRTLGQPKTERSRRTIRVPSWVLESLKRHQVAQLEERLRHGPGWNPDHLVFVTTHGTAYARTNWRVQQWQPLLEQAALPYLRAHDMRHTYSELEADGGIQMLTISKNLGHGSAGFTASFYGHVSPGMDDEAVVVMERLGDMFAH